MTDTPTLGPSKTIDITRGFIDMLDAAGIGFWSYTDEPYPDDPDRPGIFFGALPYQPVNALGVHPYPVMMDAEPGTDVLAIQVRIRTDTTAPDPAIAIADQLEATFHGREHLDLRGWHIPLMWRNSLAVLGEGDAGNFEITDNYYMYVDISNRKAAYHG